MKDFKLILCLIFILALLLRIGFIIFYDDGKMLNNKHYASDEYSYDQIATNFLNGKGFVTDDGLYALRGPTYPLFLALIYLIFGHSFFAVRLTQSLIGALTCIVIFLIGKEIFNKKVGLIASLISAIYYPFILQPAYLLTELFFTFILSFSILLFLKYYNQRRLTKLFLASLFFGIVILCRGVILYFSVVMFFWIMIIDKMNLKFIKSLSIFFIGLMLTLGIWTTRNYFIYRAFIPTTIGIGHTLYYGNNPSATGGTGGWSKIGIDVFLPEDVDKLFSLKTDKELKEKAFLWIRNNPRKFLFLAYKKFMNMWRPFYADARLVNKIIMTFSYLPLVTLGLIGIIKSRLFWRRLMLIYFFIGYYILVHMITIGVLRYRYPIMPFIIIFAAFAVIKLYSYFQKKDFLYES